MSLSLIKTNILIFIFIHIFTFSILLCFLICFVSTPLNRVTWSYRNAFIIFIMSVSVILMRLCCSMLSIISFDGKFAAVIKLNVIFLLE